MASLIKNQSPEAKIRLSEIRFQQHKQKALKSKNNSQKENLASEWLKDKKLEEVCISYLETKTSILKDLKWKGYISDKETQLKGVDFIGEWKGNQIKVDVKSIATNTDFPTFCFEIAGNVHSGQVGWLIDKTKETDHFLLTYHDVKGCERNYIKGKEKITTNNITSTEVMLINKEKLMTLIYQHTKSDDLQKIVTQIRNESPNYSHLKKVVKFKGWNNSLYPYDSKDWKGGKLVYFTVSPKKYEQPINIVVKRQLLREIAEKRWEIEHQ